jgi:hypothetical protein
VNTSSFVNLDQNKKHTRILKIAAIKKEDLNDLEPLKLWKLGVDIFKNLDNAIFEYEKVKLEDDGNDFKRQRFKRLNHIIKLQVNLFAEVIKTMHIKKMDVNSIWKTKLKEWKKILDS